MTTLIIIQIVVSILLTASILLQQRGTALGFALVAMEDSMAPEEEFKKNYFGQQLF